MLKHIKICRTCGRQYEACRSSHKNDTAFRWQDVACSIECGMKYLQKIEESRKANTVDTLKNYEGTTLTSGAYSVMNDEFDSDWGKASIMIINLVTQMI